MSMADQMMTPMSTCRNLLTMADVGKTRPITSEANARSVPRSCG